MLLIALAGGIAACGYLYTRLRQLPVDAVTQAEAVARATAQAVSGASRLIIFVADVLAALAFPQAPRHHADREPEWDSADVEMDD